jgi:hypothetical protein
MPAGIGRDELLTLTGQGAHLPGAVNVSSRCSRWPPPFIDLRQLDEAKNILRAADNQTL